METVEQVQEVKSLLENFATGLKMEFVAPVGMKHRLIKKGISRPWGAIHNAISQVKVICKKYNIGCDVRAGYETGYYHFNIWLGDNTIVLRSGYDYQEGIFIKASVMLDFIRNYVRDDISVDDIKRKGSKYNSLGPAV